MNLYDVELEQGSVNYGLRVACGPSNIFVGAALCHSIFEKNYFLSFVASFILNFIFYDSK